MEGESRNLQNDFFNDARKARAWVSVFLGNGKKLSGRIKSFDKYTLLLEGHQGEMIVFKHAISTVSPAMRQTDKDGEDRRAGQAPAPPRD